MGCGCNKGAQTWAYVSPEGEETVKRTEVEALAMKIRNDNQGEVKVLTSETPVG